MVDLLGRVGLLKEAEDLINGSGFRDDSDLWVALLGACATHLDSDIAERVANKIMVLDPDCHLSYVLLANVYKTVGRWKEAMEIIKMMRDRCVKKRAGRSWVEAEQPKGLFISHKVEQEGIINSSTEKDPSDCIAIC